MAARTRAYTPTDRAEALAVLTAAGGSLRRAARDSGVPLATLARWSKRYRTGEGWQPDPAPGVDPAQVPTAGKVEVRYVVNAPPPPVGPDSSERFAGLMDGILLRVLLRLSEPGVIESASVSHLARLIGVLIDKSRLLRHRPAVVVAPEKLDLSRLTDAELALVESLLAKAQAAAPPEGQPGAGE